MKAPKASTMPSTANVSAPPKVASAGIGSRIPDRTIRIDRMVAVSAKKAQRRAQMASRDVGSSAMRRRAMVYPQIRFRAAQSEAEMSGANFDADAEAAALMAT